MRGLNCKDCQRGLGAAPSWYDNTVTAATADVQNIWNDFTSVWSAPAQTDQWGNPLITSPSSDANLVGTPGYGLQSTVQDITDVIGGIQQGSNQLGAKVGSSITSGFTLLLYIGAAILAAEVLKD